MLVELRVRDYAVVEEVALELGRGLNVLTGETGAGKSIIVGALSLLLGERASPSVVRKGAPRATVEAVFDVSGLPEVQRLADEQGFAIEDGLLILKREVAAGGRSRAWVSGSPATAGAVGALGAALVDLHGQHEHQTLVRPADQRRVLDSFANAGEAAAQVAATYRELEALRRSLEEREARARDVATRADFLRFQLGEIEALRLAPGEDEALEAEARRLENAEELIRGAGSVHERLYAADDSVADRLAEARRSLLRLAAVDPELAGDVSLLDEALHAVTEVGRRAGDYATRMEHDPARLEYVRERLDKIFRLKRKYGPELADVLATAQRVRAELAELDESDHDLGELSRRIAAARTKLVADARRLSELRRSGARRLADAVTAALPALGLPGATFDVRIAPHERVSVSGAEAIEFVVAPNRGFDQMALARVASGGELSRIMLALRAILADADRVPVLVFDEIDAGIGGLVASAVAEKLVEVAQRHQVLVVTHLAQVAARAQSHFAVEKRQGARVTSASVRLLAGEARVEEISRMLGGCPESEASRAHARELLAVAGASADPRPAGTSGRRSRPVS
jgi:DNA repair protein RecN (Recombination protein N)